MAQEFSRQPLTTDVQVRARIHAGFLVDKVAMVQDFLRVFSYSFSILIYHLGNDQ
jgi:hypothetical protein